LPVRGGKRSASSREPRRSAAGVERRWRAERPLAELEEVVGVKHATIAGRSAVRHGHENGEVTVQRPRARTAEGEHEVPPATYCPESLIRWQ
jgi:hypothetical protein